MLPGPRGVCHPVIRSGPSLPTTARVGLHGPVSERSSHASRGRPDRTWAIASGQHAGQWVGQSDKGPRPTSTDASARTSTDPTGDGPVSAGQQPRPSGCRSGGNPSTAAPGNRKGKQRATVRPGGTSWWPSSWSSAPPPVSSGTWPCPARPATRRPATRCSTSMTRAGRARRLSARPQALVPWLLRLNLCGRATRPRATRPRPPGLRADRVSCRGGRPPSRVRAVRRPRRRRGAARGAAGRGCGPRGRNGPGRRS